MKEKNKIPKIKNQKKNKRISNSNEVSFHDLINGWFEKRQNTQNKNKIKIIKASKIIVQ